MKVVYICHYFHPEIGAPSARILEMSGEWVRSGHEVTVVTCFPNHPTGVVPKQYRGRFFVRESVDGIRVYRNFVYATPNEGFLRKTVCHLSFMLSSVLFSLPRLGKADVIIVSSPTFFSVFSALVFSRVKRCPFIFEVRDLWPAAITELGIIKSKTIIRILEGLELFLYRRAEKVIVVTQSFRDNLVRRGIAPAKVEVVFNGVTPERFGRLDQAAVKKAHGLEGRFIVLYAGAHGLSHGLETILRVAQRFQDDAAVLFLFVGEGANKRSLQETALRLGLTNVRFWPGQTREKMPEIYALGDVCLITLKDVQLFSAFIPSKMFEIMASHRPIVAGIKGEAAEILARSNAACVVPTEDAAAMAEALVSLRHEPALREKMGEAGAVFVRRHFDRAVLAARYREILESVVGRDAG